jgi:hypothetical protein
VIVPADVLNYVPPTRVASGGGKFFGLLTSCGLRKWNEENYGKHVDGDRFDCPACRSEKACRETDNGAVLCQANGHAKRAPNVGTETAEGNFVFSLFEAVHKIGRLDVPRKLSELGHVSGYDLNELGQANARARSIRRARDECGRDLKTFGPEQCADLHKSIKGSKTVPKSQRTRIYRSLLDGKAPTEGVAAAAEAIYTDAPDSDPHTVAEYLGTIGEWSKGDVEHACFVAFDETLPREDQGAQDDNERIDIERGEDTDAFVRDVLDVLATDPVVYSRAGRLVELDGGEIHEINPDGLRAVINRTGRVLRYSTSKSNPGWRPVPLDKGDALTILATHAHDPVRKLAGVTHTPRLLRDGRLITKPGYDVESGLYFAPQCEWPEMPEHPTHDDAIAAYARLADLFDEFEFVDPEKCKASLIAAMLTLQGRYLFDGAAPMFLFDAPIEGAGKGLAAWVVTQIGLGHEIASSTFVGATELGKRMTSWMIAGRDTILLDNVAQDQVLGGSPLQSATTEPMLDGRVLGKTEAVSFPNRFTFMATGINLRLSQEMSRRVLPIRQEPQTDRPNARVFRRELKPHVREHLVALICDAITILRAFLLARPTVDLRPWGSYEAWSGVVRAPVAWVSDVDVAPLVTPSDVGSDELDAIRALMGAWRQTFGDRVVTTTDICEVLQPEAPGRYQVSFRAPRVHPLETALRARLDDRYARAPATAQMIGYPLRALKDRWVALAEGQRARLVSLGRTRHGVEWRLDVVSEGD